MLLAGTDVGQAQLPCLVVALCCLHQSPEVLSSRFKVGVLIKACAGWRQQQGSGPMSLSNTEGTIESGREVVLNQEITAKTGR